jgi:hypothetical protein
MLPARVLLAADQALHTMRNNTRHPNFPFTRPQIIVNTGSEMTFRKTLTVSPSTFHLVEEIEKNLEIDYFDAGVATELLKKKGIVVSTDQVFDTIPNLKRI